VVVVPSVVVVASLGVVGVVTGTVVVEWAALAA
jgi:hypothetical protein